MPNIDDLKNKVDSKTLNFVLLSFVTGWFYMLMWLYENTKNIENITKRKITSSSFIIWIAVCMNISIQLQLIDAVIDAGGDLVNYASLLSIASYILWVVWAFKAKSALLEYALNDFQIDLRMNSFYTFLFGAFYINYCINDLSEVKRRSDLLKTSLK